MGGQLNHTDVICPISAGLNLANERETMFGRLKPERQGGLLGGQVAAVDEYEVAGVEGDCPPPGGSDKLLLPDRNGLTAGITEVLDHDSAFFGVCSGVHPHPGADLHAICGTFVVAGALGHT